MKVLARGEYLVLDQDFGAQTGQRRYVGRRAVAAWKQADLPAGEPFHTPSMEFLEPESKPVPFVAYPKGAAPVDVPATRFYLKELRAGTLWAADAETAKAAGVPFDSSFGGEYPTPKRATKE